jgi:hypothetical protein
MWKIIRGRRPYFMNRLAHSDHVRAIAGAGFRIVHQVLTKGPALPGGGTATRFRYLSPEDLATRIAFIQARKPAA